MSFPWLISSVHPLGVPSIHEGIGSPHLPVSPLYLPLSFCLDHTVLQLLLHTCFSPPRLWEPQSRDYIFSVFPETSQWTRLITTAKALLEFLFSPSPLPPLRSQPLAFSPWEDALSTCFPFHLPMILASLNSQNDLEKHQTNRALNLPVAPLMHRIKLKPYQWSTTI